MPEDFKSFWNWSPFKPEYNKYWQEMAPCLGYYEDRDLYCTYLMISI